MTDLSFMQEADGSVEALGKIWGERNYKRRTLGHVERTKTLATLEILEELGFEECGSLARALAEAWAGEEGWDTDRLIKALGATKGQTMLVSPRRDRGEE